MLGEKEESSDGRMRESSDGRVLESGPGEHVFIYFCDHGAAGLIAFPDEYLYADDLLNIFT